MNQQLTNNNMLEPTTRALNQLSPQSQETVTALVKQLAEREGINVAISQSPGLQSPIEGIPMWLAKLRAERYSPRTIHMYQYLARRYLEKDPEPTKLGIQQYLANRLDEVSPALVSNERKALASLFNFPVYPRASPCKASRTPNATGAWPSGPSRPTLARFRRRSVRHTNAG